MVRRVPKQLRSNLMMFFLFLYRRSGFVLRTLICWGIGCLILSSDEVTSFDTRLQMRGDQAISNEIVLITLRPSDLNRGEQEKKQKSGTFQQIHQLELHELSESSFWNEGLWLELLTDVLKQKPRSIGISFFFPEGSASKSSVESTNRLFTHPKIFWSALGTQTEHPSLPVFSDYRAANVGGADFLRDEDGVIRRFFSPSAEIPHLTEKITGIPFNPKWQPRFINFRGSNKVFAQFFATDVLAGRVPLDAFKNKIIIIGGDGLPSHLAQTPLGTFSRAQIIAHIADNLLEDRWIHRAPFLSYTILLLAILALTIFIITQYPQSVALIFLLWLGLLSSALSVWVFDSHYFWLPIGSVLSMITITWIVFVGYQANKMERRSWQLQQEQRYLSELEQLKNNFVSLISHDLKTPIAKIQSIIDRLMRGPGDSTALNNDLLSLRSSSEELNKYIQSILQILRVESRDFRLNREVCDLNELVTSAIEQLYPLAKDKNITIEASLEPMFSIEVDTTLIREVLINLIDNAIKYSPNSSSIRLKTSEIDDRVHFEVTDTGNGIPAEELETVWKKFVRGRDQDLKSKGSGLGLYLVKYFIELHGGSVNLQSEITKGTTVAFTLPLDLPKDEAT